MDNSEFFKSMPVEGYDPNKKHDLLAEDLMLPVAVVKQKEMFNNVKWMQAYSDLSMVSLCPHGKTTMIPELFRIQVDTGAWGITVANSYQLQAVRSSGIERVLMANQLVGRQNMNSVFKELAQDSSLEFFCLVDNVSNVLELSQELKQYKGVQLNVLLEISPSNGRAGIRQYDAALELAQCIEQLDNIQLWGLECFEGVINGPEAPKKVELFLESVVEMARKLDAAGMFGAEEIILTAGGSAYYDIVAKVFSNVTLSLTTRAVIRPGCYLTHDEGIYKELQEAVETRDIAAQKTKGTLLPAIEVMAYIQSLPEPNLAIINMGKRDVSFDAGLPLPKAIYNRTQQQLIPLEKSRLTNINDQHAYMQYQDTYQPSVGDIVIFGVSHPCLTFDKWQYIPLVDQNYNVNKLLKTYF